MNYTQLSLAAFPGVSMMESLALASAEQGSIDPYLGEIALDEIQICPQVGSRFDEDLAGELQASHPNRRFRLHANVWVEERRKIRDLADWSADRPYWSALARVSRALGATAYSAHAGQRRRASFQAVLDAARAASDEFGCRVAVEGHYPTHGDIFHVSSWSEYAALHESRVDFALDLSHLNIVGCQSGIFETTLVQEMLASEHCLEIHVSGNDGTRDQHAKIVSEPWWLPLMRYAHPDATIFCEAIHRSAARRSHR